MFSSYGSVSSGIGLWIRERRFRQRMRAANAHFDAFVVSIPKAGRTWHRVMLGYYLTRLIDCDPREAIKMPMLCKRANLKLIRYSHNGSEYACRFPVLSPFVASPLEWQGRDLLLLVRDPGDVLVSAYHHARFRQGRFAGNLSDFIRGENTGIVKLLVAYNRWHDNRHRAASFEVMSYEQMRSDPADVLRRSLRFAGLSRVDPALIEDAVEFTSVKNMRRYELEGYFRAKLRRRNVPEEGRKVRDARIGASKELGAEERQFIGDAIARLGNPFASYSESPDLVSSD
jgi:alcohol sulfotransferase